MLARQPARRRRPLGNPLVSGLTVSVCGNHRLGLRSNRSFVLDLTADLVKQEPRREYPGYLEHPRPIITGWDWAHWRR
jgi:hypothetical protein